MFDFNKIVLIFVGLFLIGLGFFYFFFLNKNNNSENLFGFLSEEKDKEVESIKKVDKSLLNKENQKVSGTGCNFPVKVSDGETVVLYSKEKTEDPFSKCADFSQRRTCSFGSLSGDPFYKYPTCSEEIKNCKIKKSGVTVLNNQTKKLYSLQYLDFALGKKCEQFSQKRTCRESFLNGNKDYVYETCEVTKKFGCLYGDGKYLGSGKSKVFYSTNSVAYNERCGNFAKTKICQNKVLDFSDGFSHTTCSRKIPKNCYFNGRFFLHFQTGTFYSKKEVEDLDKTCSDFVADRTCLDGVFTNEEKYKYLSCIKK